ncbi:response regulator [Bradyrhizobium sp. USDA 10063]
MNQETQNPGGSTSRTSVLKRQLREAQAASGIGAFVLDLSLEEWAWSPPLAGLFGFASDRAPERFEEWLQSVFIDDVPKIRHAIDTASASGGFYVEFRVRRSEGPLQWLAGKGEASDGILRGIFYDIGERKQLEARLLAVNETLEARLAELREEARALEVLNRTGIAVGAELDLERLVQAVTDAGVELSGAQFGAFFYNVVRPDREAYTLFTLSGASREAFAGFPMPRNTEVFEPTFRGTGVVRSPDILADPRYGKMEPYRGMPHGHLPVRSYLAVPVLSRSGEVLGGLFFGHGQPGIFTARAERILVGLAAQAAVAIDNSRLFAASQRELAARKEAEARLQALNRGLEERALQRAAELASSTLKLEESERRFRLLVEGVNDYAIFMLDPNGLVINWNPGAQRIKGYTREEIIGQHFSRFYTEEDRAKQVPWNALETAAATGKFETEGWRVRKNGTQFWASVVINAIRDARGAILGFAKVTRDLTERRAAEERLHQSQKMEGIGQLTGGVAHDFNNLLTIIIGNLETLQRNFRDDGLDKSRLQRAADNAMRGARRAEALTQRLLAFSRQQPLEPKAVDVGRMVAGMSDLLRRTLGENIAVETVHAGGLWRAFADSNQLEVAILNLAVNARDAMPKGGKLTIETANVHLDEIYAAAQAEVLPGQYVLLAVSDTGVGMTADTKAKAFDPFFTTKDVGHGTGLGLSQVYGFVKQSRGHVKIYSEVGEGTTVKIYLPRHHADAPEEEETGERGIARGRHSEIVLVVEDDEDVRTYSTESLRELGYSVLEASHARAALQMLDAHPDIAVLFTDVGLPGGTNGRQLAEEARKRHPNLKILFTTGYARNAIVHDGRLDPGVELLTKPFTQAALGAKLRDILDARSTPARVLVVEDEALIQMLAREYLEECALKVDVASSAAEALNKLRLIPGGVDAMVVDMGLPDSKGDTLIREVRSIYPSMPIVIASGQRAGDMREMVKGMVSVAIVNKPYTSDELKAAIRTVGIRC